MATRVRRRGRVIYLPKCWSAGRVLVEGPDSARILDFAPDRMWACGAPLC